jgi:hypothetical protein
MQNAVNADDGQTVQFLRIEPIPEGSLILE